MMKESTYINETKFPRGKQAGLWKREEEEGKAEQSNLRRVRGSSVVRARGGGGGPVVVRGPEPPPQGGGWPFSLHVSVAQPRATLCDPMDSTCRRVGSGWLAP